MLTLMYMSNNQLHTYKSGFQEQLIPSTFYSKAKQEYLPLLAPRSTPFQTCNFLNSSFKSQKKNPTHVIDLCMDTPIDKVIFIKHLL